MWKTICEITDLIRITKAFDSRRQLKVLKRKFQRS